MKFKDLNIGDMFIFEGKRYKKIRKWERQPINAMLAEGSMADWKPTDNFWDNQEWIDVEKINKDTE